MKIAFLESCWPGGGSSQKGKVRDLDEGDEEIFQDDDSEGSVVSPGNAPLKLLDPGVCQAQKQLA